MNDFQDKTTAIAPGGLRYSSKTPGSPFSVQGGFTAAQMSCFLCGKHRGRPQLAHKRVLGKARLVCRDGCLR